MVGKKQRIAAAVCLCGAVSMARLALCWQEHQFSWWRRVLSGGQSPCCVLLGVAVAETHRGGLGLYT